jgi:hypothetical protein
MCGLSRCLPGSVQSTGDRYSMACVSTMREFTLCDAHPVPRTSTRGGVVSAELAGTARVSHGELRK